jgi:hypothetical protein
MKHLTEKQIVLHCFGDAHEDGKAIDRHLEICDPCRAEFDQVKAMLQQIPVPEVPELPSYLSQKLWLNLRDRLPQQNLLGWRPLLAPRRWVFAGATAALILAAFLAGRFWPHDHEAEKPSQVNPQRVVLVTVGDHLERSQRLLIEVMNADSSDRTGLPSQQKLARSLLDDNRLFRQSAQRVGNPEVARVLDELERVLVEIANAPSAPTATDLREIRSRIQSQDLLFKINVVHSNVTREGEALSTSAGNQRL